MADKKDSVIFYHRQIEKCRKHMNAEQFGRLMFALFDFDKGDDPEVDDDIALAFELLAVQNEIDREKYQKLCERNRKNGKKGGAPKGNQNARKNNPKQPNGYKNNPNDNVNDNDNDNVNVNVNDNEVGFDDDTDDLYQRFPHGTLKNVMLTKEEYQELYRHYEQVEKLIDKVSVWLPNSNGKHVYDHYPLCLKFAENDEWPKRLKYEPVELPEVKDPLTDDERKEKMAEMRAKLGGMFSAEGG